MLDVIGAGATATTNKNWHEVWLSSLECRGLQQDLENIHAEGRKRPSVGSTLHKFVVEVLDYIMIFSIGLLKVYLRLF